MSRDDHPRIDADDDDRPTPGEQPGRLRPTPPGLLTAWLVVGLVGGWLLRRVARAAGWSVPEVSWTQILLLVLVAAILGGTAFATRRTVQRAPVDLLPHQAVNRLALARACALVGVLLAGGYLGHAVSWLGVGSQVAQERVLRGLVAAVAGAAVAVTALLLERACRVRSDDPRT
ncbi:DUF3180 domain-containing protein [Nocardioides alkalitolerans]|uniref:DUF3180 domain-containing protein n=1 Tax=Nocardioides alkalitolerans TaxID=281714 RepID=UPI00041F84CB|nr:DUF3180 domain-containing protein [Nocardioides alkalitolerans]